MKQHKPVEISKEEYCEIRKALLEKAMELAKLSKIGSAMFFSRSTVTCAYDEMPKTFRVCEPDSESTEHFMPFPCNCKRQAIMSNKEEVICLNEHYESDSGNLTYYITTHRIGRCPWKKRYGDR